MSPEKTPKEGNKTTLDKVGCNIPGALGTVFLLIMLSNPPQVSVPGILGILAAFALVEHFHRE